MADIPVLEAAPGQDISSYPRRRAWLVILVVTIFVLGSAGAGAWYFLSGTSKKSSTTQQAAAQQGPPLYVVLDPPFVVNFEAEQLVRFLQVTVQVMSRDPETIDIIKTNDPVVRNDLLLLLGNQKYETISSREGKEQLRRHALNAVRIVVAAGGGKANRVEAVYFTSFVMQ
jgi:flagellar FliL protein